MHGPNFRGRAAWVGFCGHLGARVCFQLPAILKVGLSFERFCTDANPSA